MIGKRDNRVIVRRRTLRSLLRIHTQEDFHKYLITDAVDRANAILNFQGGFALKSVFSICSGSNEAIYLARYPFERIVLSGVTMPNQELKKLIDADSRIEYLMLNAENTGIPSASFDLVFCKAGLHHCAGRLPLSMKCCAFAARRLPLSNPTSLHWAPFLTGPAYAPGMSGIST